MIFHRGCAASAPRFPPDDSPDIHSQGLIFHLASRPGANARPAIVNRSFDQSSAHRILMNVIDFLHQRSLADQRQCICLLLPQRVAVMAFSFVVPEFLERGGEPFLLEVVDDAAARDSFRVSKHVRRFMQSIRDHVNMIWHQHVSEEQEVTRVARLIQSVTGNCTDVIGAEELRARIGDRRQVECGGVS